nr:AI-2E family transporter [Chloroflexota bacterium]
QSDAIALHPSAVILSLIVGGSIAGLLGAIFALPLAAAGRDLYRYFFRRLSEHDPTVPPPDDPDLLPFRDRLPDAQGRLHGTEPPPPITVDAPAEEPPAVDGADEAEEAREGVPRDGPSGGTLTR